jgi:GNAT superfamily N-acetyltransferase
MKFDKVAHKDLEKIKNLQPDDWTDITEEFKLYIHNDFCEPIKVAENNKIIGLGCSMIFKKSSWIAHIIVDRALRRRGIGTLIVNYLISVLKAKKIETILLIATELGEPIYKKVGFRLISDYIFFKRASTWTEKEISKNIRPYSQEFYSQIIELDEFISGECRESLIKTYLGGCFIYINNKKLNGYYLPNLGEGAIYADVPEAGLELMKLKYSTVDKAVIPAENNIGVEFLKQNGFIITDSIGKRMFLGKDIDWKPECFYCRIGGNYG